MSIESVILVVDDEALIRIVAIEMLNDAGFVALGASNADEALDTLAGRSDISIVFSDINMPGTMDGLRLANAIRNRWPPIHLILTSGLACPGREELRANGRFIRKPYEFASVIALMRELLGTNPSP